MSAAYLPKNNTIKTTIKIHLPLLYNLIMEEIRFRKVLLVPLRTVAWSIYSPIMRSNKCAFPLGNALIGGGSKLFRSRFFCRLQMRWRLMHRRTVAHQVLLVDCLLCAANATKKNRICSVNMDSSSIHRC